MATAPRSGWPWMLVALLAAGGLVLLLSRGPFGRGESESVARRDRTSTEGFPAAPRGGPPEPAAEVTVEPASVRDAPEPGIEPPTRLRIRVAAVEGGVPLVGARVEAWEVAQGEPDADLPLPGLTHVAGTTDGEGRVVLDPPVAGGAVRLLASASGYRVGQASFDVVPAGEVTLGLRRGLVIEGSVVDPRGEPVPGIEVRARHSDRPAALSPESGQPAPLVAGAEEASTQTDPQGAFRLDGLSSGHYRVGVFEVGWVLAGPAGASPRGTHFWVSHALAEAGTTALRLVAVPIRVVRLEPIDAGVARRWGSA